MNEKKIAGWIAILIFGPLTRKLKTPSGQKENIFKTIFDLCSLGTVSTVIDFLKSKDVWEKKGLESNILKIQPETENLTFFELTLFW